MRDPKERLRDILEAIAAIDRYRNRERRVFEQDEMLQVWFLRHLQIIGEAARGLPEEIRNLAPDIPWRKIIGMRNILVLAILQSISMLSGMQFNRTFLCSSLRWKRCSGNWKSKAHKFVSVENSGERHDDDQGAAPAQRNSALFSEALRDAGSRPPE